MVRGVMISVVLSGVLVFTVYRIYSVYQEGMPARVTRIDIYADRMTYRTNRYPTPSLLEIGLKAANDPPEVVALHDCSRRDDFETVIEILRELGYGSFDIELPDDC